MGTSGFTAEFIAQHQDDDRYGDLHELGEPQEAIYDGADTYLRVGANWTGFFLGDPGGPRGMNDPLWPLDALFGARDAVEVGAGSVRGVPASHYRVTIDLARADAALPAGVTVPAGPYRRLSQIPAEVWLDADGLARRIAVMTDPTAGDGSTPMWSIVELWDFGVLADITPPGPGEVVSPRDAYSEDGGLGQYPRRRRPRRREPRSVRRKRTSVSRTGTGATVRDPVASRARRLP
jgi:hypothetical protein